jgi:hypothetical protein
VVEQSTDEPANRLNPEAQGASGLAYCESGQGVSIMSEHDASGSTSRVPVTTGCLIVERREPPFDINLVVRRRRHVRLPRVDEALRQQRREVVAVPTACEQARLSELERAPLFQLRQ